MASAVEMGFALTPVLGLRRGKPRLYGRKSLERL
jgi:hypothetical protein